MTVHVRYEGMSYDLQATDLQITPEMAEQDVKRRVANFLDVAPTSLESYMMDRGPQGDLIVRPAAIYG